MITYFSRTLTKSEGRYRVMRKQVLPLIVTVRHSHYYLSRQTVGAVKWLMNFKNPEGQTARWIEILGMYDLEIHHPQGCTHSNVDGLSWCPCGNCMHCEPNERKEECKDSHGCEEKGDGDERKEVDGEEHRCAAAKRSGDNCTQGSQGGANRHILTVASTLQSRTQESSTCRSLPRFGH